MEALLKQWDGEETIIRFDPTADAWILIAIHSTRLGPAAGGTRMKPYPELKEALTDVHRLSKGMTYKFAAAGIDNGGGKAVIAVPPELSPEARTDLLRRYGALIYQLGGLFSTGADLGTSAEDMDIIRETSKSHIFGCTIEAGGCGDPAPFTALGVFTAMQATAERLFGTDSLEKKRVLLQGVGSVGGELVTLLRKSGAMIQFSDVNEETIQQFRDQLGLQFVDPDKIYDIPCDILAPCAVGAVLNENTIPHLQCPAVVGAANNQLAVPEDADRLKKRNILYAPDYVSNSGGAISLIGMETKGWSRDKAMDQVVNTVKANMARIFELAERGGITTDAAAQELAEQRLKAEK
jgi:leucine dehydrogenase